MNKCLPYTELQFDVDNDIFDAGLLSRYIS